MRWLCKYHNHTRLSDLKHIQKVQVETAHNSVSFEYVDEDALAQAIKLLSKLGYPIDGESNPLIKKATKLCELCYREDEQTIIEG